MQSAPEGSGEPLPSTSLLTLIPDPPGLRDPPQRWKLPRKPGGFILVADQGGPGAQTGSPGGARHNLNSPRRQAARFIGTRLKQNPSRRVRFGEPGLEALSQFSSRVGARGAGVGAAAELPEPERVTAAAARLAALPNRRRRRVAARGAGT